jgi:hypothetical protein
MRFRHSAGGRALLAASILSCAATSAWPQQETRQDRGKRVVQEALAAVGGDAFLGLKDRTESGRLYSFDGGTGRVGGGITALIYTQYLPPVPGQFSVRIRQIFGNDQDEGGFLFTPGGAWNLTFRGARPLDEADFATYRENGMRGIFYILRQRLNEPGLSFYSQGGDIFEHVPVEIVDITDADNVTITVYFDRNTHLPLRQTFRRRNEQFHDFDTEITSFAKYRQVKGITLPLETRRDRNEQRVLEMFITTEELNKGLKDELFTVPANLKVLPKAK